MTEPTPLARAFAVQGDACAAMGAPFWSDMLRRAAIDIDGGASLAPLLTPWAQMSARAALGEAVPLRWLGCLHDLALSGGAPDLAAAFPAGDGAGDSEQAWREAVSLMRSRPDDFAAFMRQEPQTNESRRSICLLPGFLTIADETGLPLRLFELGASAGLNQLWDLYHHDLGAAGAWGDPASPVRLQTDWRGPPPPLDAAVRVLSRAACDRSPIDIREPAARRRLKAYVWPDQAERLRRLDHAVDLALATGVVVEAEDAVTWVERRATPALGAATVVYHSVFWQYLPAASQAALTAAIGALGAGAGEHAPLAWLRMEPSDESLAVMELRLTVWPGGEDRRLGRCHPHGAWVAWGED